MHKKLRYAIVAALMGMPLLAASQVTRGQNTPTPVVAVKLEKSVITQHEPVILDFIIKNSSPDKIAFDLGYDFDKIDVQVADSDGGVSYRPRFTPNESRERARRGVAAPPSVVTFREAIVVAPDVTDSIPMVLSDRNSFSKVGRYQITVQPSPLANHSPASARIRETSLVLTVTPRDEASLESACRDLLAQVENPKSAAGRIAAAVGLSEVSDPVAIPFLAQALKQRAFSAMMIQALARLRTPEAIQTLVSASQSDDAETRSLARAALAALGEKGPQR